MVNHGQTRTGFAYARFGRFIACALGFLFSSAISEASPWTTNSGKSSSSRPGYSAFAPQIDVAPHVNVSSAIAYEVANMLNKQNIETALRNNVETLSRPNVGLISSGNLTNYPYVDRYLSEQLGDKDITHYYILREDYEFKTLSGESIAIPAGFIWDGASISKVNALALEVGNTRYNSALAEGLIHDYMYRDPRRFSKDDADELFFVNLVRCGNADPIIIYEGVHLGGWDSYLGHKRRQDQGLYDVFTTEFYKENLKIFQGGEQRGGEQKDSIVTAIDSKKQNDSDFDVCKCAVPDDSDFRCRKCGKISKWLAPHRDKEFEEMLKR